MCFCFSKQPTSPASPVNPVEPGPNPAPYFKRHNVFRCSQSIFDTMLSTHQADWLAVLPGKGLQEGLFVLNTFQEPHWKNVPFRKKRDAVVCEIKKETP